MLGGAVIVASVVGALACGASIVCGVVVGAAAGLGYYAAHHAGRKSWNWHTAGFATLKGAIGGLVFGGGARFAGWKLAGRFKLGVRFSRGSARGTDFMYKGVRKFGIHSHRFPGQRWHQAIHYHRRPGIGWHRPRQKGW